MLEVNIAVTDKTLSMFYPSEDDFQYRHVKNTGRLYESFYLDYIRYVGRTLGFTSGYDIGVCFANHSVFFGAVMGCRVACFEPNKEVFPIIEKALKANHIDHILFNVALSDQKGTGSMIICDENLGASKVRDSAQEDSSFEIATLDDWMTTHDLFIPDFIKIDTEGFEIRVLNGAEKLLRTHGPDVFAEIYAENIDAVFAIMKKMGYQLIVRMGKNYHFSKKCGVSRKLRLKTKAILCKVRKDLSKVFSIR